jgi:tRNA nucleotidyltransferase/poly(A) polymerase
MITETKLKKIILSDKYNSTIFEMGRSRDVYLVGGYVRDLLRGYHSQDRDYIMSGNIMSLVQKIKKCVGGTIVTFKKGGTTRIATKNGLTFDFSKLVGTLNEDLSKRDFTINAIAWSPHEGIIDLFQGIDDIKKKIVRVIKKDNFIDDPLRMLRAYRFAAEFDGYIEKGTRQLINILNNNIKETSSERITLEIFQLLNLNHSAKHLKKALSDSLLNNILLITSKELDKNIKQISLFEKHTLNKLPPTFKVKLKEIFSQNLTNKGLLCFILLMKHLVKEKEHDYRLKISNKIDRRINLILRCIEEKIRKGKAFDIYMKAEEATCDLLILKNRLDCLNDYKRFLSIWDKGIISSEDIIQHANNVSGKGIGIIIKEIKRAQYEGRVRNKAASYRTLLINITCS